MLTIWKFPLVLEDFQWLWMPHGAELLSVQAQAGKPQLWALVDPSAVKVKRSIRTCGTGHSLREEHGKYVGTYQLDGGALVFHVFDMGEER